MRAETTTDTHLELFELDSGNVIEIYERESDAIDALIQGVANFGSHPIETFALPHVILGKPVLIAMQGDLVSRIAQEMQQLVPIPAPRSAPRQSRT